MTMPLKYHDIASSTFTPSIVHDIIHDRSAQSNTGHIHSFVKRLFAALAERRQRQQSYVYLSRLTNHELTDIGVTRRDLESLRKGTWRRPI